MNENIESVLAMLDDFRMSDEMTYSAYSTLYDKISLLDDLLKEQKPRVLTLEKNQVSIASSSLVNFTWVEEKDRPDVYIAMVVDYRHFSDIPRAMDIIRFHGGSKVVSGNDYGKTWRCWSFRPTDEQRKAVRWK